MNFCWIEKSYMTVIVFQNAWSIISRTIIDSKTNKQAYEGE